MKRVSMFVICAALASPVFAADDLCTVNLQKLNDSVATKATLAEPLKGQVEEAKAQAVQAQSSGDLKTCATHAERALQLLEAPGEDGGAANS